SFVAFGIRTVAFDRARRRVYAGVFLSGDVLEIDPDTGAITDRWFAGRFIRYVTVARDGAALLVASNLGIVRIPLPPACDRRGSRRQRLVGRDALVQQVHLRVAVPVAVRARGELVPPLLVRGRVPELAQRNVEDVSGWPVQLVVERARIHVA